MTQSHPLHIEFAADNLHCDSSQRWRLETYKYTRK